MKCSPKSHAPSFPFILPTTRTDQSISNIKGQDHHSDSKIRWGGEDPKLNPTPWLIKTSRTLSPTSWSTCRRDATIFQFKNAGTGLNFVRTAARCDTAAYFRRTELGLSSATFIICAALEPRSTFITPGSYLTVVSDILIFLCQETRGDTFEHLNPRGHNFTRTNKIVAKANTNKKQRTCHSIKMHLWPRLF